MPNISETLKNAALILQRSGIAEPRREAGSLLAFSLRKDRTFLITRGDYELSPEEEADFEKILRRRASREPLQYITGRQEFYGLDFVVTPDVLIPRPETELLVEKAIEILRKQEENARFCEIGTGSGCLSISILHNVRAASAIGLDVSPKALKITALNAERHGVSDRLNLKISDVFSSLADEKFALIASNPPYIPRADIANLQREVRDFEPLGALTDEADGLSIIEKIVRGAPRYLVPGGFLLLEIGFGQSRAVKNLFDEKIWRAVEALPDLQNIPRTVRAQVI
ncbi:MAG TPA: peptide chain release factor N(5)-glutamine methyltransferase [Pyrinomonadaceae bacterium]